jgi:hypothetical protein
MPDSKTDAKTIPWNAPALEVLSKLKRRSEWVLPTAEGRARLLTHAETQQRIPR